MELQTRRRRGDRERIRHAAAIGMEYRRTNAHNAVLPEQQRHALRELARLNLPAWVLMSRLDGVVYKADADHAWVKDVTPRERTSLVERFGWRERGKVLYSPECSIINLGVLSRRLVTNGGVGFIVDAFQNLTEPENMNWHEIGTSSTAEAVTDTGCITPVESRVAGTQSEPASNQYRTVGITTATAIRAVVEHCLMSASTAGVGFDRSVFSVYNLAIGDSLQNTYTGTFASGG